MFDFEQVHMTPATDPLGNIVHVGQGRDVEMVIVDGRIVVEDSHSGLVDQNQIRREAREAAKNLWGATSILVQLYYRDAIFDIAVVAKGSFVIRECNTRAHKLDVEVSICCLESLFFARGVHRYQARRLRVNCSRMYQPYAPLPQTTTAAQCFFTHVDAVL